MDRSPEAMFFTISRRFAWPISSSSWRRLPRGSDARRHYASALGYSAPTEQHLLDRQFYADIAYFVEADEAGPDEYGTSIRPRRSSIMLVNSSRRIHGSSRLLTKRMRVDEGCCGSILNRPKMGFRCRRRWTRGPWNDRRECSTAELARARDRSPPSTRCSAIRRRRLLEAATHLSLSTELGWTFTTAVLKNSRRRPGNALRGRHGSHRKQRNAHSVVEVHLLPARGRRQAAHLASCATRAATRITHRLQEPAQRTPTSAGKRAARVELNALRDQGNAALLDAALHRRSPPRSRCPLGEYRRRLASLLAEQPFDLIVCVSVPGRTCPSVSLPGRAVPQRRGGDLRRRGTKAGSAACCTARSTGGCCATNVARWRVSTASWPSRTRIARPSRASTPAPFRSLFRWFRPASTPSTSHHQLSTISHQPSAISHCG